MINFEQVKEKIKNSEDLSDVKFDFDINSYFKEQKGVISSTGNSGDARMETVCYEEMTLLHYAIRCKHQHAIRWLLSNSADIALPVIEKSIYRKVIILGHDKQESYGDYRESTNKREISTQELANQYGCSEIFEPGFDESDSKSSVDGLVPGMSSLGLTDSPSESSGSAHHVARENACSLYQEGMALYHKKYYQRAWHKFNAVPCNSSDYSQAQEKLSKIIAHTPLTMLPTLFERVNLGQQNPFKPIQFIMTEDDYRLQVQTEKHYFSASRTYNSGTKDFSIALQNSRMNQESPDRYKNYPDGIPIPMHLPSRGAITAELATMEASFKLWGRGKIKDNKFHQGPIFGWQVVQKVSYKTPKGKIYFQQYGFNEVIMLFHWDAQNMWQPVAPIYYRQKLEPHQNYVGNAQVAYLGESVNQTKVKLYNLATWEFKPEEPDKHCFTGSYTDILQFLEKITALLINPVTFGIFQNSGRSVADGHT
jgi:hypothetical protein